MKTLRHVVLGFGLLLEAEDGTGHPTAFHPAQNYPVRNTKGLTFTSTAEAWRQARTKSMLDCVFRIE